MPERISQHFKYLLAEITLNITLKINDAINCILELKCASKQYFSRTVEELDYDGNNRQNLRLLFLHFLKLWIVTDCRKSSSGYSEKCSLRKQIQLQCRIHFNSNILVEIIRGFTEKEELGAQSYLIILTQTLAVTK